MFHISCVHYDKMFKFTLLLVGLAVVGTQLTSAKNIDEESVRSLQDWIDKAKKEIEKLTKIVNDAITKAEQTVADLAKKIKDKAAEVIANGEAVIQDEISKVQKEIADLEAKAKAMGVNITDCIGDNKELIKKLGADAVQKLMQCVTDEVSRAVKLVTDTVQDLEKIKDEVVSLPDELSKCINGTRPLTCIIGLIGTIVKDGASIPLKIQKRVAEAVRMYTNIEADMAACATSKAYELADEVGEIGVEVAKCVANKINNATTAAP